MKRVNGERAARWRNKVSTYLNHGVFLYPIDKWDKQAIMDRVRLRRMLRRTEIPYLLWGQFETPRPIV